MIKILCVLIFYSDILRSRHSVLKFDWDTLCTKMLSRQSVSITLIQTLCTTLIQTLSVLNFDPKTMFTHLISRHSISSTLIKTLCVINSDLCVLSEPYYTLCTQSWSRHNLCSPLIQTACLLSYYPDTLCDWLLSRTLSRLFSRLSVWSRHFLWSIHTLNTGTPWCCDSRTLGQRDSLGYQFFA